MEVFNLFDHIRFSDLEEVEEGIFENEKVRALRTMSLNQVTDFMIQDEDEFVILMDGFASIETESEIVRMKKGDFLFIPKGLRHRVIDQDKALWFCLFVK
ncbi:nif11 domain/cupin domain protein [Anaerococcus prevotii]|uniref:Cupin 2 conserved barrel domain protein n=1 Tax=Anaerococcus prevotii (strain ATCC 9321 / DSM 20548 / JCM 6508 / NCTC 11806 / PC1) TaxID=525919 RepID=C7RF05_ANAPD|nr:cupin domain-containing protein [Anaerococcus prevotii]ACV28066.1 Cupin 2 conserved barrel domain protein [Anaerococcus prevotii DSM 20548]SUU93615.1 nif11 domain/cupin domain protein [Anaerococcus prevotii]